MAAKLESRPPLRRLVEYLIGGFKNRRRGMGLAVCFGVITMSIVNWLVLQESLLPEVSAPPVKVESPTAKTQEHQRSARVVVQVDKVQALVVSGALVATTTTSQPSPTGGPVKAPVDPSTKRALALIQFEKAEALIVGGAFVGGFLLLPGLRVD